MGCCVLLYVVGSSLLFNRWGCLWFVAGCGVAVPCCLFVVVRCLFVCCGYSLLLVVCSFFLFFAVVFRCCGFGGVLSVVCYLRFVGYCC